jgi:hypothetical protein
LRPTIRKPSRGGTALVKDTDCEATFDLFRGNALDERANFWPWPVPIGPGIAESQDAPNLLVTTNCAIAHGA